MFKDKKSLTSVNALECVGKFAAIIASDFFFVFFSIISFFFYYFILGGLGCLFVCLLHVIGIASLPPAE